MTYGPLVLAMPAPSIHACMNNGTCVAVRHPGNSQRTRVITWVLIRVALVAPILRRPLRLWQTLRRRGCLATRG
jgi:hypothetical protein